MIDGETKCHDTVIKTISRIAIGRDIGKLILPLATRFTNSILLETLSVVLI